MPNEKHNKKPSNYFFSFIQKMKNEEKITDDFLTILSSLSIEDILALKLELASSKFRNTFYGFPLFEAVSFIVEEACIRYAFSVAPSLNSALKVLGINLTTFRKIQKSHRIEDEFPSEEKNFEEKNFRKW